MVVCGGMCWRMLRDLRLRASPQQSGSPNSVSWCFPYFAVPVLNSVADCPVGARPAGDSRSVNSPEYRDGMCFYFLEASGGSSPITLGENGCNAVVPGSTMPCVTDNTFNAVLESLLDDGICFKCSADGFALANGFDSTCTSAYEPSGTSRDSSQCTSMSKNKNWINRCDNYVSSLCVLIGQTTGTAYCTLRGGHERQRDHDLALYNNWMQYCWSPGLIFGSQRPRVLMCANTGQDRAPGAGVGGGGEGGTSETRGWAETTRPPDRMALIC